MVTFRKATGANKLEKSILRSARTAQREYYAMTGGEWITSHGPESFLQAMVARAVAKETGHYVYVDVSRKKIGKEMQPDGVGPESLIEPIATNAGQRPDILIWRKSSPPTLRAIIEIKRTSLIGPIKEDADKMRAWLDGDHRNTTAYILACSEHNGKHREKRLEERFARWKSEIDWVWKGSVTHSDPDDSNKAPDKAWAWGIVLLRAPSQWPQIHSIA